MKHSANLVLMQLGKTHLPDVTITENSVDLGKHNVYDFLRVIRQSRTFFIRRKNSHVRGLFAWHLAPRNYDEQKKPKFPKKSSKNWR